MIQGVRHRSTLELLRQGRVARAGPITVRYAATGRDDIEVAFALRRRGGTAVVRNRCRRRIQAWLRERAGAGGLRPGAYLVAVRDEALNLEYGELGKWVDRALRQLAAR